MLASDHEIQFQIMSSTRKASSSRGSQEKETASPISIDYDHFLRLCLKHWLLLIAILVAGIIIGFLHAMSQVTIYSARATIVVQAKDTKVEGSSDVGEPDTKSGDLIKTFEQLLQTKDLVARVVKNEHLNENAEFLPPTSPPPVSEEFAMDLLSGMINIQIRPLTRLIDITVEHHSPQMAQFLANKLAEESILQEFDQRAGSARVLSDYLQKEVQRLQGKLAEAQQAVQNYRAQNKESPSLDNSEDFVVTRLKDLNSQYMVAQAQVSLLKERYGENHPKLIEAEATEEELRAQVSKAQDDALKLNNTSIGYNALVSVAESYKLQYNNMLKALNDAQVQEHVEIPGISIAEEAQVPYVPVRPYKTKEIAVGAFGGALCGLGLMLGLYFFDSSLRTVAQTENTLGLPVLAAVPILTEIDGRSTLPTFSDPQSFVAESFRGLRATLLLHDREQPLKTILVASAIPGEGKSFCAANLAVALAQAGLKTLLIDADLRLPTSHTYFDLPPGTVGDGFTNILLGRASLGSAVIDSPIPNLMLLLTSTPADAPAELLSGLRLPLLLEEAAKYYDRIIIDSAPLNAVSDTMLIVQRTDAILLVIRAAQTPASECKAALDKIYNSKMKPLGLILNYLPAHSLKSYSYGYSYGQKPKEKNAK
jgi:succinoglycan biosynthesis transport protein ExoP